MAKENEVTFYTDFDETMVGRNTPLWFFPLVVLRRPSSLKLAFDAWRDGGLGGVGFLRAIAKTTKRERVKIVEKIVPRLTLKTEWLAVLEDFVNRHPRIMNIKLIIITRNLSMFPELFMKRNDIIARIQAATGRRFKHDFVIVGNENLLAGLRIKSTGRTFSIFNVIDNSSDKVPYVRRSNAFYIGDAKEYEELAHHPRFKKLHFIRV